MNPDTLPTSQVSQSMTLDSERMLSDVFTENRAALRRRIAARLNPQLKGRLDPSDVVQETLAEACARIDEYIANPTVPLLQWLFALAEQNAIEAHRKHVVAQKRSTQREENADRSGDSPVGWQAVSEATDPGERAAKVERMERLHQAISRLSPTSQAIVRMRFLEGRKLADIAEVMDLSIDAVAKRALRSLRTLNAYAGDLGLDETGDTR